MSANLKPGDFVRHSRLGPARVLNVQPDHVTVAPKSGDKQQLTIADAEKQLLPVPPDGFCALLYQREVNSDYLRDNIEDAVLRLMRDRRRQTLALEDLRREFNPILARDQKGWASWWPGTRKALLATGRITLDPKRKNVFFAPAGPSMPAVETWISKIHDARSAQSLLSISRELEYASEPDRTKIATLIVQPALANFVAAAPPEPDFLELLCALCHALPYLDKTGAETVISAVDGKDLCRITVPADLEADLGVTLTRLTKSPKVVDLATALLKHPSVQVHTKAFSILNTEKYRLALKRTILEWIDDPDNNRLPKPSLYLREDFTKYLRVDDIVRLYRLLIGRSAVADSPAVRSFLDRFATPVLTAPHCDEDVKLLIFSSRLITDEKKRSLIQASQERQHLVRLFLREFRTELQRPLLYSIGELDSKETVEPWEELLRILKGASLPELFRAVAIHAASALEADSGTGVLRLAVQVSELLGVAIQQYPECQGILENALGVFGRHLLSGSDAPVLAPVVRSLRTATESAQAEARRESERLQRENASLVTELEAATRENKRLAELADMLKSSAAFDRRDVEMAALGQVMRPILLLVDDLERQAGLSSETSVRSLIANLERALLQAGAERVGTPGETVEFNASLHEFIEEPRYLPEAVRVRVVRSGYVLGWNGNHKLLRRALVRPI